MLTDWLESEKVHYAAQLERFCIVIRDEGLVCLVRLQSSIPFLDRVWEVEPSDVVDILEAAAGGDVDDVELLAEEAGRCKVVLITSSN
ncbi:unnamed protein product [Haemonchus placei]|uniref:DUF4911 domain-containing protein n=1 Tax=Haemonchus placei TaxID=6290 RepID=A0A0N4WV31_HAEPC|nr:unnamed protein product [Haemonchus placei]